MAAKVNIIHPWGEVVFTIEENGRSYFLSLNQDSPEIQDTVYQKAIAAHLRLWS